MSKLSKLLQITEEERKGILAHFNTDEEEFEENVQRLKDWVSKCEHLPKDNTNDNLYKVCLLNGKMSMEKAKRVIEGYFTVRALYYGDFFERLIPNTEEYALAKGCVRTVAMPKLTPDLCRITIHQILDPHGDASSAYMYEMLVFMMGEIRIFNDMFVSNIVIIDLDGYGWKNLIKFTPVFNQKLVTILNAIQLRVQSIHLVGMPSSIDQIIRITKAFLPRKIFGRINSHKSFEELHEHVPREYLPSDFGGSQKSINELYDEWCEHIEESEDFFQRQLSMKSTEKFELDPEQRDMFGIGAEGSFKTLSVD